MFITQPSCLFDFHLTESVSRKWFVLAVYQIWKGISGGPALKYFTWFIGAGGIDTTGIGRTWLVLHLQLSSRYSQYKCIYPRIMIMSRKERKLDRENMNFKGATNEAPTLAVPMHAPQTNSLWQEAGEVSSACEVGCGRRVHPRPFWKLAKGMCGIGECDCCRWEVVMFCEGSPIFSGYWGGAQRHVPDRQIIQMAMEWRRAETYRHAIKHRPNKKRSREEGQVD